MKFPTPEDTLNCVNSTVFAEVELRHHWTPASPGHLPRHSPAHLSVLLVPRPSQRGVRRQLPAPRLPDLRRRRARLLALHPRRVDGKLQLHGIRPRLPEVRTPGRGWRSLHQVRQPVMPRVPGKVQFTVRRRMNIRGGNHHSKRSGFRPVFTRVTQTSPNPRWRGVRTSPSQLQYFT